MSTGLEEPKQ